MHTQLDLAKRIWQPRWAMKHAEKVLKCGSIGFQISQKPWKRHRLKDDGANSGTALRKWIWSSWMRWDTFRLAKKGQSSSSSSFRTGTSKRASSSHRTWNSANGTACSDPRLTAALVDRVIHHAHILNFTGDSFRVSNALSRQK